MKALFTVLATLLVASIGYGQCTAAFNYTQSGSTVNFNNISTAPSSALYSWNFDDGSFSSAVNPSHTYSAPGVYIVCLDVFDSLSGCFNTYCDSVNVTPSGCYVSMGLSQSGGVIYGNNYSYASSYEWFVYNTAGNLVHTSTGYNMSYTYGSTSGGTYSVCLYGYDSTGNICDTVCSSIFVSGTNCDASFYYVDTLGGGLIDFYPTNPFNSNLTYSWSFSNGNTSSSYYPPMQTFTSGIHQACLTVTDSLGNCSDTFCDSVFIGPTPCYVNTNVYQSGGTIYGNNYSSASSYQWIINNSVGSVVYSSTTYNLNYTPSSPGTYSVCLLGFDGSGNICDTTCSSITIQSAGCNADFTYVDSLGGGLVFFYPNSAFNSNYNYYWTFGNGNTSSSYSPSQTYNTPGNYIVCLTVTDSLGNCTDTYCDSVVIGSTPCFVNMSAYQSSGVIYGNNYSSSSSYQWFVYDGSGNLVHNTAGYNLVYTTSAGGTYTVCLYGYDFAGNICDTICTAVTVPVFNCDASFSHIDTAGGTWFIPNSAFNVNYNYSWTFDNGNTSSSYSPFQTFTPGTYVVCLTVSDSLGNCWDTYCDTLVVPGVPCQAEYIWFVDSVFSAGSPNTVYIFDLSQGNNLSYFWDFGDGNTSTVQYPSHVYANNGSYLICLTVTDSAGNCTDTYCDTIDYTTRASGFTINVLPYSAIGSVDVEEHSSLELTKLYPNPATEQINIEINSNGSRTVDMMITDIFGKTIQSQTINVSSGSTVHNLDVTSLAKGSYFIILNAQQGQTVKRFVVK